MLFLKTIINLNISVFPTDRLREKIKVFVDSVYENTITHWLRSYVLNQEKTETGKMGTIIAIAETHVLSDFALSDCDFQCPAY